MKTPDVDRQRELERQREMSRELATLTRAIVHPFVRLERNPDGSLAGAQRIGTSSSNRGMVKKVIRRDERGRLLEVIEIPITDLAERIAEVSVDGASAMAVPIVTVGAGSFADLPRSTDIEAIRVRAEHLLTERLGRRVEVRVPTACDQAAEALYDRVRDSFASMAAGARSVMTVDANKLPRELNHEAIARGLAALIAQRHPDKAARVEITLQRTSVEPTTLTTRPVVGFRPAPDERHRVGDWSKAERVEKK
jgi:hypothetical protein